MKILFKLSTIKMVNDTILKYDYKVHMSAKRIFYETILFPSGLIVEMVIWKYPKPTKLS